MKYIICLMKRVSVLRIMNIVLVHALLFQSAKMVGGQNFTAMYVFGDSLVDNGNNNYLYYTQAKANFYPYGIDFYLGPTGRFTNGKTCMDFLAELIGLPYIPPYANPLSTDRDIVIGLNFASAAGGILEESGQLLGDRFSFSKQVENFEITKKRLQNHMNDVQLQQYLSKALVVVILGSNDYVNNYFNPNYPSRSRFKPEHYADIVINQYTKQIEGLYNLGLRRFYLAGIGPIGCIPVYKTAAQLPAKECVTWVNDDVQMFNTRLRTLVDQLNATHSDALFVFGDIFHALIDILARPSTYGLTETEKACCGLGRNNAETICLPFLVPCSNRNQYAFWDSYHPTEVVHKFLALAAYNGPTSFSYPFNIKEMASIQI